MTGYRTSLARAPSAYTPDQLSARQEAYEREMWWNHRAQMIRESEWMPGVVRLWFEARARQKFGKTR